MTMSGGLIGLVLLIALVAVAGGLWILAKQKIVVDKDGNPTSIEIPLFGKMQTNYPSLLAVFLGLFLAWAVQGRLDVVQQVRQLPLTAQFELEGVPDNAFVFVHAVPQRYVRHATTFTSADENAVTIDVDDPGPYTVIAYALNGLGADGQADVSLVQGPAVLTAEADGLSFNGRIRGGARDE